MTRIGLTVSLIAFLAGTAPALAQHEHTNDAGGNWISLDAGYAFIRSDEIVYEEGKRISHLIWEAQTPTLSASARVELAHGWSLSAQGTVASGSRGHMEDYDWLQPHLVSYDFDDWTDRSQHPQSRLNDYFSGDIALGRDFDVAGVTINLHGGFKYTTIGWFSRGGTFLYSEDGYRDKTGELPPDKIGISYRQRFPGVFLGANLRASYDRWTFDGQVRGGVTLRANATDHHWARNLLFEDRFETSPFMSASLRTEYRLSDTSAFFAGISYDRYFHHPGHTETIGQKDGNTDLDAEQAGARLRTLALSGGIRISF